MPGPHYTATSSTGTTTITASGGPGVVYNCTSIVVSLAGATSGVNAVLTVYDGAAVTGTVLFEVYLNGPGAVGTGIGSVGNIQDIPLPKDAQGRPVLQGSPGSAMNIQVVGTGNDRVRINARITDGLP
jgi:hypothetical protein